MSTSSPADQATPARWQPIEAIARRVLGVLVEKAKTTPENYPLSLNALRNGCNQKSNRSPLMQLDEDQIEETLEQLRSKGAVAVVQGSGRVDKYRHLAYEWLGVDKVELAVMAELLLRGAQTVGELRGRAARMEPIKDLGELRPVLDRLAAKELITYLTPAGRGCVVTHALYLDHEMQKIRREHSSGDNDVIPRAVSVRTSADAAVGDAERSPARDSADDELARELDRLRDEVASVKREFQQARAEFESTSQQLRRDLDELNRQLGV